MAKHDPLTLERWQNIITDWRSSGLGVMEFCRSSGINRASLHHWRNVIAQLERDQSEGQNENTPLPRPKQQHKNAKSTTAFVPIRVVPDHVVEVILPTGVQLRVPITADAQQLARLVAVLGETRC